MRILRLLAVLAPALAMIGCSGTAPEVFAPASLGYGAVIIRGRIILPEGETQDGAMWMNLESGSDRYRLRFEPGRTTLARVEPDIYKLYPTRDPLGLEQRDLTVVIAGHLYHVPFPRDILRKDPVEIKPTHVVAIGTLVARLLPIERGREPRVDVTLDDSNATRRQLIQDMIDKMMDPKAATDERESAVSWTHALEVELGNVQAEPEPRQTYTLPR